jgi:hypothetical protein
MSHPVSLCASASRDGGRGDGGAAARLSWYTMSKHTRRATVGAAMVTWQLAHRPQVAASMRQAVPRRRGIHAVQFTSRAHLHLCVLAWDQPRTSPEQPFCRETSLNRILVSGAVPAYGIGRVGQ